MSSRPGSAERRAVIIEHTASIPAVRRNIMIAASLGFLLSFAQVDASQFKFLEVKLGPSVLYASLFCVLAYYVSLFLLRTVIMFGSANDVARREYLEWRKRSQQEDNREYERMVYEQGRGLSRWFFPVVLLFEFYFPVVFGAAVMFALAQRFGVGELLNWLRLSDQPIS